MVYGIIYVFLIIVTFTFIQLFLNRKWKLIYIAYGYQDYFIIIGKLKNQGVPYKTKLPMNVRSTTFNDHTQYNIYVKKELEHTALQSLYHN